MAFYRPEGNFGPVCDPIGVITAGSDPVVIDEQVADTDFKPCKGFAEYPPNPSWVTMPTQTRVLCREIAGGAIEYKFETDIESDALYVAEEINKRVADLTLASVATLPPFEPYDPNKYCEEFFGDSKLYPETIGGVTTYYKLKSLPRSYSVTHTTWDDEMNVEAAWVSQGVCSFEDKTIAAGTAAYVVTDFTVNTTGTHTLRYRFSKQGEVWLNYFDEDPNNRVQLLNLTETRSSYDNSQFETKQVTLTEGDYKLYIAIENPTVGTFKKLWDDSPAAVGMQIYEGAYSSSTVNGIPTSVGIVTSTAEGPTYTSFWGQNWIRESADQSGVFAISEGGQEYNVSFSNSGLTGTAKVKPIVTHTYNSTTQQNEYITTAEWTVYDVTAFGSGRSVDDRISISYTGSVGGTITADVKVFAVTNQTTTTGTKIWSTSENLTGYFRSTTPFDD